MKPVAPAQVPTGVAGLDLILKGGLPAHEMHVVSGEAGTGKTTLALQFLLAGAARGERTLYLTLSQSAVALRKVARSHGFSLRGVHLHEIASVVAADLEQTIFRTADVELGEITAECLKAVERLKPARVVLDSLSQLRALANESLPFQRQLLALRNFFMRLECTVLLVDNGTREPGVGDAQGLAHGVITLERHAPDYGNVRRRLLVEKMRGLAVHGGYQNFRVRTGGLEVYPRLEVGRRRVPGDVAAPVLSSGIAELDALLGGGLDPGTATLLLGATGTGKTSLATLYAHAAARRGERVAIFLFEERLETFFRRAAGLGLDLEPSVRSGLVTVEQVNPGDLSPGEFSENVRRAVDAGGARLMVIDSISGYFHTSPQEELLATQLHELLSFLSLRGVLTLLVAGQHGIAGQGVVGPLDVSYLCDALVLLRHFDAGGAVRKAIAVIKKRAGPHENTIRELLFERGGVRVGEPLQHFDGLLTGTPTYHGELHALLSADPSGAGGKA